MFRWLFDGFPGLLTQVLKYQVVTKTLMVLVIVPLYGLATAALVAGEGAVTNATISGFLLSWRGVVLILMTVLVLALGFVVELGGFVVLTARYQLRRPETRSLSILRFGFGRLRNVLGLGGLALLVFMLLLAPLTGIGANFTFLKALRIPNFILDFINSDSLYSDLYTLALVVVVIACGLFAYTFHLVFIANMRAGRAMLTSARLVWRSKRIFITGVLLKGAVMALCVTALAVIWWACVLGLMLALDLDRDVPRVIVSALLLIQHVGVFLLSLLIVPYAVHLLTRAFYRSVARDRQLAQAVADLPTLPPATRRSILDRIFAAWKPILAAGLVVVIGLATVMGTHFDQIYRPDYEVDVVGHRAGGYGTPENSISGLRKSIRQKAQWVEIDIQRTSDGHYVLNHDATFERVGGVDRAAKDMTLNEVRQVDISTDRDGSEHPPELEEFLRVAAGKIKVIIELKGETADEKMGLDAWQMSKRLGMRSQVMIMGIDYDLIHTLETAHPEIPTGYVFFFSIGDPARLTGDYIIVEEGQATPFTLSILQLAGKQTFVWTVDTPDGVRRAYQAGANGIITDLVDMTQMTLTDIREESTLDVFLWLFLDIGR